VGAKFFPVTVSAKLALPVIAELGFNSVIFGGGTLIANFKAFDVPPPGAGFATVTVAVLTVAMSAAEMAACKLVFETNVVARVLPFHCTLEEAMKFVPVTVSTKPASPAKTALGPSDATVGVGLSIVKLNALETPPPGAGVETVTIAIPPADRSAAVIAACKLVLETNVVVRAVPFHCTVEEAMKFVPVTVSTKPTPPASAALGPSDTTVGVGLSIVKLNALETPPPGAGVETVTMAVPLAERSAAVIAACKLVLETNVVVRAVPFHCTVEEDMKLAPVTVSTNPAPPKTAELGLREPLARDGFGLGGGGGGP